VATHTHTHTRTYTTSTPANPYLRCTTCGTRVEQFTHIGDGEGPVGFEPCGHRGVDYDNVCPSWSPVDGCTCTQTHRPPATQLEA
jgi:hypothetical protein